MNNNGFDNSQFDQMSVSGVENVTRKSKGKKVALIGGITAAVIVGGSAAAYCLSDTVKNQVKLRTSKPEKYYAWVTEKNSESLGKTLSESYKKSLDRYEKGTSTDLSLSFTPTDNAKEAIVNGLLGGLTDSGDNGTNQIADIINKTDKYALTAKCSNKKGTLDSNIALELGSEPIVGLDFATDLEALDFFVRIPQLKEQWLGFELGSDENSSLMGMGGVSEIYKSFLNDPASIISPEELETEVNRYANVWGSFADNVKIEKKEAVDVCDIEVNYTVATVKLTEKDSAKLGLELLKEVKKDKILKKIMTDKIGAVDADEYETSLDEGIDRLKENLKDDSFYDDDETEIIIETYIDATGTVRGMKFADDSDTGLTFISGKDGNDVRGEFKAIDNGKDLFSIELNAKEKGGKYDGEITVTDPVSSYAMDDDTSSEQRNITIEFSDFEIENKEKCYFNGEFTINVTGGSPISISCSTDGKKQEIAYQLSVSGTNYGKFALEYAIDYNADVKVPDKGEAYMLNIENASDFQLTDYISKEEFKEFISNALIKIGFDSDYVKDGISSIADNAYDGFDNLTGNDYDYDDDDFGYDDDFDFDDDFDYDYDDDYDDNYDYDSDFEIDDSYWDSLEYDDFKDFMTEEEFKEYIEESKKAS